MPHLNSEFNYWIKPNNSNTVVVALEKLKDIAVRHSPLIGDMEDCEREISKIDGPYHIAVLYEYFAMAYYQLAAISRYQAQHNPNVGGTDFYDNEARGYALKCIEYADKGFEWNNRTLQKSLAEPMSHWWPQDKLESDRKRLQNPDDRVDFNLQWYRTAGRAIRAYYNLVPFKEAYAEVKELKIIFSDQFAPEDDPTMQWVLTSKTGERPQSQQ
jgi:hypothetical protein